MSEVLNVTARETRGTSNARRLRNAGSIPAILYGHGGKNVSLTVPTEEIEAVLRHGSHVVDLQGAAQGSALLKEVQWDPFGIEVLHIDLTRVKAGESVEVTLVLELRGEAPGTKEGGVVQHSLHELEIECPVMSLPDKLEVNINHLALGDSITAAQVEIPQGAKLLTDAISRILETALIYTFSLGSVVVKKLLKEMDDVQFLNLVRRSPF